MPATRRLILIIIILFLLLLFLVVPGVSWSQTPQNPWAEPARELAKKIAVISAPRQSLTLTVRNLSSLSETEVAWVQAAIEAALRNTGMRLVESSNAAEEVRITFSENMRGLLWVAEIARGDARDVAIFSFQRAPASESAATEQMYFLSSKLIWQQDERIIDFAFPDGFDAATANRLVLLEPRKLVFYQRVDEAWQLQKSLDLPEPKLASRDPRSFLVIREFVLLMLPEHVCRAAFESPSKLECWNRDQEVPIFSKAEQAAAAHRPVPGKNHYLVKSQSSDAQAPGEESYYELIEVIGGGNYLRVLSATDGKVIVSRPNNQNLPTSAISGWGSQLMVIGSGCSNSSLLLATGATDWTEADSIQAFDLQGTDAVPASNRGAFPGPILELQGGAAKSVNAIVRNLKTGRYEAYTITVSCGR